MSTNDIVRMANQIAEFFSAYPEDEALAGASQHIVDFWDPRMRAELEAHLAQGGAGLSPLALAVAKRITVHTQPELA
ncbi:MAG: formate dehydrogenase subunit delta [Alphaproteobacteria bacterium]|nr:formate dehydrogenase subunit delta [Alphaproteobacteria bacterium]